MAQVPVDQQRMESRDIQFYSVTHFGTGFDTRRSGEQTRCHGILTVRRFTRLRPKSPSIVRLFHKLLLYFYRIFSHSYGIFDNYILTIKKNRYWIIAYWKITRFSRKWNNIMFINYNNMNVCNVVFKLIFMPMKFVGLSLISLLKITIEMNCALHLHFVFQAQTIDWTIHFVFIVKENRRRRAERADWSPSGFQFKSII